MFERIIWTQHSRGVLRCGISNIRFTDIKILREGPEWCLATSGGGPQVPLYFQMFLQYKELIFQYLSISFSIVSDWPAK